MISNIKEKRTICSSIGTFVYKIIFPVLWVGGFGFGTYALFQENVIERWIFLFIFVTGAIIIYWLCIRLKHVAVDKNFIYISNYLKTIKVPINEIAETSESRLLNIHPITVRFKNDTDFGDSVFFMPVPLSVNPFLSHPIVKELRDAISNNKV